MEATEKRYVYLGYNISGKPLFVSIIAIFAALTTIFTIFLQVPIPATNGYFDIGDAGVMMAGLLFGPWVGLFAGGIGSMLGDVITGYFQYAPLTLVVKGLEGFLAGLVSNPRNCQNRLGWRDFAGVVFGGLEMVSGYFLGEFFIIGVGFAALGEVPGNFIQIGVGALIALAVAASVRKGALETYPQLQTTFFAREMPLEHENEPPPAAPQEDDGTKDEFIAQLDEEFKNWGNEATTKDGKV